MSNYFVIEGTTLKKYTGNDAEVVWPEGIEVIGEHAFEGCKSIKSVKIPEGVKEILGGDQYHTGNYGAFYGCENLERVTLPDSVKEIGMHVFEGCINLKSINLPKGLERISRQLFSGCVSLESIVIPNGADFIAEGAFEGCESLREVAIPDSVTDMGWKVFDGCKSLEKIVLSRNLTDIGFGHFWDGAVFQNCVNLKHIELPEGLDELIFGIFEGCKNLESVEIPESVTSIGGRAFYGCENLEDVKIPENVKIIGEDAFKGCTKIKNIALPEGIETIGLYIFTEDEDEVGNVEGPYNIKPEWLATTERELHGSIAKLIELKWLNQMTPEDWANLYLTQDASYFKIIFANLMTDSPDVYLSAMIGILKKRANPEMFFNAANYAQTHAGELKREIIELLLETAKSGENTEAIAEMIEGILNDEPDPYAFISEYLSSSVTNELADYYISAGGEAEYLNSVDLADGSGKATAAIVLTAVAPYLGELIRNENGLLWDFDLEYREFSEGDETWTALYGNWWENDLHIDTFSKDGFGLMMKYAEKYTKIISVADRAAQLLDHSSLMDFIERYIGAEDYLPAWLLPYCRYADEGEIRKIIRNTDTTERLGDEGEDRAELFRKAVLLCNALLLSDTVTAVNVLSVISSNQSYKNNASDILYYYEKIRDINPDIISSGNLNDKAIKSRLFDRFLSGHEWNKDKWLEAIAQDERVKPFAELLVWAQGDKTFIIKGENFADSSGNNIKLNDSKVKLAHPMEMDKADVAAWQKYFAENSLKQPFIQIWSPLREQKILIKTDTPARIFPY